MGRRSILYKMNCIHQFVDVSVLLVSTYSKAMIELQLPEHDTVVERDLQKFCLRQTTLTQRLILFGFYPSAHHIQKLVRVHKYL